MVLNPFEDKNNEYDLRDVLANEEYWGYRPKKEYEGVFGDWYKYEVLVRTIDTGIKWHILQTGSYQGDYWYIGEKDGKIYFVDIGYGSCSGCDSLMASENDLNELIDLQDEIKRKIREFDSVEELKEWVTNTNEWWWASEKEEILKFIEKGIIEVEDNEKKLG